MMRISRSRHDVVFYLPSISALLEGRGEPPGGAETQVFLIAREMASRGLKVALIARETQAGLPPVVDGIDVIARSSSTTRRGAYRKVVDILRAVSALVRANGSVYVQRAAGIETGIVGLVARAMRRRFIYSSANVVDFEYERLEKKGRNVALFHLGVRLADQIVVQTEEQVQMCQERFGRRPLLLRSVAESVEAEPGEPGSLLWIGRLTEYKNPLEFVQLAAALAHVPCRMVCVRSGRHAERLWAEVVAAADGVDNLAVLPSRTRDQLGQEIARAAAVVNTSDYEGMPNIFLEGWSRGVPALSLHHDPDGVIERWMIGRFAAGSRDRFAQMASEIWNDRGDVELARRCRDYVEQHHALDRVVDGWIDIVLGGDARVSRRTSSPANLSGVA